jgi:iron complex outermembrane receptor protein
MKNFLFVFSLFAFLTINIFPQEKEYQLNEVVVTSERSPIYFSDLNRDVKIIGPDEIKTLPVNSIQDILQFTNGVDLQTRGISDVQSDVSIRGGNFNETLVLIDGVKVNDPQTGHHNLNLPISLDNVERIEILKGPGSKIYGPDAFNGIINIITKKGREEDLSLDLTGGQNSYYKGGLYFAIPLGPLNNHFSFYKEKSDGYRYNTAFDITDFSYNSTINFNSGSLNLLYGYNNKKFGANGFYAEEFKNQWEHTSTHLLNLGGDFGFNYVTITPKLYWRRNNDDYLLDYTDTSSNRYENIHHTDVLGSEIQASLKSDIGTSSIGGEYSEDRIKSTNLGDHRRDKRGIFFEQNFSSIENFNFVAGAFLYDYTGIGWKFWPGLDLGYQINSSLRLYGSIGEAFRIPTYTELYYTSPIQHGNPNLSSEETRHYEVGIRYLHSAYNFSFSVFRKEGKNLIDWVKNDSTQPWTAENISKINTNGFEVSFGLNPQMIIEALPFTQFSIGYTYLDEDKNSPYLLSVYLLNYLRHQLNISLINNWWFDIKESWNINYENRVNYGDYFLIDTQISRKIKSVELYIKGTNLLNKSYEQIGGVPMPGRWIYTGAKLTL